ncbi:MAG: dethiobiotin synthase [Betaproteobacteria bacterium]|nr:dethiobiotin synthase [Betaproteobacteria bacterium]
MSKPVGFFITGTDTEIGKTLVAGALIQKFREQGINALGFKPVAAGTYQDQQGNILNEDIETLRIAANLGCDQEILSPYVFEMPIAPHLAAKKLGTRLDLSIMLDAFEKVSSQTNCIIVEGAGGFLIPLNEKENLSDLVQQLKLPVIMVVGMRLGCINHALLTYEAMTSRQLKVAGWVANSLSSEMAFLQENIKTLQTRIQAPFLGSIPPLPIELQKSDQSPYSIEALQFAAQHLSLPNC